MKSVQRHCFLKGLLCCLDLTQRTKRAPQVAVCICILSIQLQRLLQSCLGCFQFPQGVQSTAQ